LRQRTPSCIAIGAAQLPGHSLRLHKKGRDGSGKCNAFYTGRPRDLVLGVIYALDRNEKPHLDQAESLGCGYNEMGLRLSTGSQLYSVFTYVADADYIDDRLKPFGWYRDLVLQGAESHGLPTPYIEAIARMEAIEDPDAVRAKRYARLLDT
ncbi:MAG: gamma-glutamylcyclotransferase, partial [bacterium]|nr:gamma-glutamylcyclotransferase [bacterium]